MEKEKKYKIAIGILAGLLVIFFLVLIVTQKNLEDCSIDYVSLADDYNSLYDECWTALEDWNESYSSLSEIYSDAYSKQFEQYIDYVVEECKLLDIPETLCYQLVLNSLDRVTD